MKYELVPDHKGTYTLYLVTEVLVQTNTPGAVIAKGDPIPTRIEEFSRHIVTEGVKDKAQAEQFIRSLKRLVITIEVPDERS